MDILNASDTLAKYQEQIRKLKRQVAILKAQTKHRGHAYANAYGLIAKINRLIHEQKFDEIDPAIDQWGVEDDMAWAEWKILDKELRAKPKKKAGRK